MMKEQHQFSGNGGMEKQLGIEIGNWFQTKINGSSITLKKIL